MSEERERVYCRNCLFYDGNYIMQPSDCNAPDNIYIEHTWFAPKTKYKQSPEARNKHNDCKDYRENKTGIY